MINRTAIIVEAGDPRPDHDAGSVAVIDLAHGLSRLGFDTSIETETRPDLLATALSEPRDVVIFSRPATFVRNFPRVRGGHSKIVYFAHDLHFLRISLGLEVEGIESNLAPAVMKSIEGYCFENAHVSLLPTEDEVDHIENEWGDVNARQVNYFLMRPAPYREPFESSRGLVFVGSRDHAPNRDGIVWFVRNVLPKINELHPNLVLTLVGDWETEFHNGPNVKVMGNISDRELSELLSRSLIGISPLRFGAGMKRKTLHYLASGLPVVSTDFGLQGISADVGRRRSALKASVPEDWVAAISSLQSQPDYWTALSKNALSFISEHFSEEAYLARLFAALD